MNISAFRKALLSWFESGHRDLPWRRTRDPYAIWISEIMLQQTRAAAAIPYYLRFLEQFPTATDLARAPESEVLAAWSGLGYYHRARNLHRSAQQIDRAGGFPNTYEGIRALAGVGDYTAAAVASIAFALPHAVLDGNVLRVIARMAADGGDIVSGVTRRRFQAIADDWLDAKRAGAFNQAMMELGATVCLPRNPQCLLCPGAAFCEARAVGTQAEYPVKGRKTAPVRAVSELMLMERDGSVLIRQRATGASRMAGFWELPDLADFPAVVSRKEIGTFQHTIVNTRWTVRVFRGEFTENNVLPARIEWRTRAELGKLPITTVTRKAFALSNSID